MKKYLVLTALCVSCSSLTPKEKGLVIIGSASLIGGVVGAASAPEGESKGSHAGLWAGIAGTIAGLYVLNTNSDIEKINRISKENQMLKDSLDAKVNGPKTLQAEGAGLLGAKLPEKVKGLVQPGGWKLYKIDRWVRDESNENVFVHQDQELQIIPPSISN
ncbi:MAG: hypothetical protein KDD37_10570 [Bdellovibrionales bacterium]|nr:hypothetical protein [Bdellovibrionales bacterium]